MWIEAEVDKTFTVLTYAYCRERYSVDQKSTRNTQQQESLSGKNEAEKVRLSSAFPSSVTAIPDDTKKLPTWYEEMSTSPRIST